MERRIKTLYIITIIAIMGFLAMQAYWLYGRYEYSLSDYEHRLTDSITDCVDRYNELRRGSRAATTDSIESDGKTETITVPRFTLSQQYGDTVKTTRTARIFTYKFSAHELLGLPPGTTLNDEQMARAVNIIHEITAEPTDSVIYDASGAKDENEAWVAAQNVHLDRKHPFTAEGIDSMLRNDGINATVRLTKSDTIVWNDSVIYGISTIRPQVYVSIPYSQLEGRIVEITCRINPFDVLPQMSRTLLIALVVSVSLIVCLVLQFSTVLKLSRLDKIRNSFITTMIHELKRPISTLKMCISGITNDTMMADPDTRSELIAETRRALDSLSAYFSRLRDITFNRTDQIPLNITSFNLRKLADGVIASLSLPSGKNVTFRNEIAAATIISADRSHLFNILTNLMENAVKYSGPQVEITVKAETSDRNIRISVADTGYGIARADIRHIFSRFYRGKSSMHGQPGMGLGLAYVRLLAEAHGGHAEVESDEGAGSTFTITLPQ